MYRILSLSDRHKILKIKVCQNIAIGLSKIDISMTTTSTNLKKYDFFDI